MSETKQTTATAFVDFLHTHLRVSRTMLYLKLGEVEIRGAERLRTVMSIKEIDRSRGT
ncbi:hypothetical protein HanRHA438_Chr13g0607091 [Helianthus annuus]|uniref:Uncharacterized protein n=1 Tax=Helianthus annuus TaxID=4232 RepID=A0A251STM6_HELAN|nr:hypothetical protein HanXRQr2_Chr13g0596401 [Helianthus annuus]KAJ0477498.1 hypothetical protein HanHA300_Chr13g0489211 [Helianthus annuus]KAJ0481979.1 hypothetical protein HanIR_Chr13g0648791 [Helianthus annuus]KAJ0498330.1 hypothetical protein HanHA89_Chr13g0521351 [Helianthus annuus]KAJ0664340.1 hypothetical protein HanLR1_Chr13g0491281 [Helianthus annuus]